jgi:hypothetical protein
MPSSCITTKEIQLVGQRRQRRPRSRPFGKAVQVVVKVASVVRRPMGTRLGHFQHRRDKRIILRLPFVGNHLHGRAVRQLSARRQHHRAILDCAFEAHAHCVAQDVRQRKPGSLISWALDLRLQTLAFRMCRHARPARGRRGESFTCWSLNRAGSETGAPSRRGRRRQSAPISAKGKCARIEWLFQGRDRRALTFALPPRSRHRSASRTGYAQFPGTE